MVVTTIYMKYAATIWNYKC